MSHPLDPVHAMRPGLLQLAEKGIGELVQLQKQALGQ